MKWGRCEEAEYIVGGTGEGATRYAICEKMVFVWMRDECIERDCLQAEHSCLDGILVIAGWRAADGVGS